MFDIEKAERPRSGYVFLFLGEGIFHPHLCILTVLPFGTFHLNLFKFALIICKNNANCSANEEKRSARDWIVDYVFSLNGLSCSHSEEKTITLSRTQAAPGGKVKQKHKYVASMYKFFLSLCTCMEELGCHLCRSFQPNGGPLPFHDNSAYSMRAHQRTKHESRGKYVQGIWNLLDPIWEERDIALGTEKHHETVFLLSVQDVPRRKTKILWIWVNFITILTPYLHTFTIPNVWWITDLRISSFG